MPEINTLHLAFLIYERLRERLPVNCTDISLARDWDRANQEVKDLFHEAVDDSVKRLTQPGYTHYSTRLPREMRE